MTYTQFITKKDTFPQLVKNNLGLGGGTVKHIFLTMNLNVAKYKGLKKS